jgi:hypothetical protein
MIDEIRRRLEAQPFVPFTIYIADGREYRIPTADHAHIPPKALGVNVWTDNNRQYALPVRQISGVEGEDMAETPTEQTS